MSKKNNKVRKIGMRFRPNIGLVIIGIIAVYLFVNLVFYLTSSDTKFYEVVSGSNAESDVRSFTGIALRKEKIQHAKSKGYIEYFVREGARVSKNTTLYSIDSQGALSSLLKKASTKNTKLSDDNLNTLSDILYDFNNNYENMEFSKVYDFKSTLKGAVVDLVNLKTLKKYAKEQGDEIDIEKSACSGIVLYKTDGYEKLKAKDLEASDFEESKHYVERYTSGDKVDVGDKIYKCITNDEWKIAVQLDSDMAEEYRDQKGVTIKFSKDNLTTTANFDVVKGKDGNDYGIISMAKYAVRYANDRYVDLQIMNDVKTGLKIPKSALVVKKQYIIPKEYGIKGGNSDEVGFNQQVVDEGKVTSKMIYPNIASEDNENYYVSTAAFKKSDILLAPNSQETYTINDTKDFTGVYNINNGYTVFVRVKILSSMDDYYIVQANNVYGLSVYDRIVLNGDSVKENQILD